MADTFRYRAFLSYSHSDEAVATRLHRALESYVLPRNVQKAHALPRRLIPIFRDVDELAAASGLTTRLQDALDQSQWLIVLCSPAAAQSKYVNSEIEYFLQKHGASRILCALVQGEPAECFPPAIKALKEEPLAADFRPGKDFELSKLKLIAALAGVGFTELRNREAQRRKRQQLMAASLVAGLALGALLWWDLFHREHVDHYVNYVRKHGIWHGVDRISVAKAAQRAESYRFTRRGRLNPPQRVDYVNAAGLCGGDGLESALGRKLAFDLEQPAQRYCAALFAYTSDGEVRAETLVNRRSVALESLAYTTPDLAQLTQDGFAAAGSRGGIYYVQFVRDAEGRDVERRFLHSRGVPRPNDERAYGYRFDYDDAGRVVRQSALDADGQEAGEVTRYEYDANAALVLRRHEDGAEQPRWHKDGYVAVVYLRDAAGNITAQRFVGADGAPVPIGEGYAQLQFTPGPAGLPAEQSYLDVAGKLVPEAPVSIKRFAYDARGNLVAENLLDAQRRPSVANEGIASFRIEYDAFDDPVLVRFYDAAGQPAAHQVGNHANRKRFDEHGNLVEQAFLGLDLQPIDTNYGAVIRSDFDTRDTRTSFRFFGADGKPFVRPDRGFAVALFKFDERGNRTEMELFGKDGERVKNHVSVSHWAATYDDRGNQTEIRYFDERAQPTRMKFATSVTRNSYDRFGNAIASRYFAPNGAPDADADGGFGYDVQYDRRGRVVRTTALGADERPVRLRGGYCIVETSYNTQGRIEEVRLRDTRGGPLPAGRGTRRLYSYDGYAREIEQRSLDVTGALAPEPDTGCALLQTEYDAAGRVTAERCLDVSQQPAVRKDEGWATRLVRYEHGRIVEERKLGATGRPVKPKT